MIGGPTYKNLILSGRIDCAKSLFVYGGDLDCSSFQRTDFAPIFMDDFTQQEINQAQEVCGGPQNLNCIYDFLATQNEAIANVTKTAYDTVLKEQRLAGQPQEKKLKLILA